jgi:hypothetical protein
MSSLEGLSIPSGAGSNITEEDLKKRVVLNHRIKQKESKRFVNHLRRDI